MARRKRFFLGCTAFVVVLVGVLWVWLGGLVSGLYRKGFFDREAANRTYNPASSQENLKAMYKAMMLYHDSEGQFPDASGWMDAIKPRLEVADMSKEDNEKKLIRPDLLPPQTGRYGYAMNAALSGKYKDDVKDPKTPLIFDSTDTALNAHGDPTKLRMAKGAAIAVDGTILP